MSPAALKQLRDWFTRNAAELPWRPSDVNAERDPYAVWISETMLQQTQVSTVRDYFIRWMNRFPDVATLAATQEEEVFRYWQGLGYYSRARNILKTANIVAERFGGILPKTRRELESLPGIGAYTAGAILSLAYHQREAILDGNLVRVFSRLNLLDSLPTDRNGSEVYWGLAREVANHPKGYLHNEALMELGRTICKVKNPDCSHCPFKKECKALECNRVADFPPSKKHAQKDWHGAVLVIESSDHKILAVHGGQKFFSNQFALPHLELGSQTATGLPIEAEPYVNADFIESIRDCGSFRHSITIHKMECKVLHIKIAESAQNSTPKTSPNTSQEFRWIQRARATETLANSFSLKALKKANF